MRSLDPPVVLLPVRDHGLAAATPAIVGVLRSLVATVVVHGTGGDDLALAECLEAGAEAVVADGHDLEGLLEVVRRAVRGEGPVMRAGRRNDLLAELSRHRRESEARWARAADLQDDEEGATMVEHGLMVALVAVVVAGGAAVLGTRVDALFRGLTFL